MAEASATSRKPQWPGGRAFAFGIVTDTDNATVENVGPVFQLLKDRQIRITKTVWVLPDKTGNRLSGETLADPHYLDFVRGLQDAGFELAFHNARCHDSVREETIEALERFKELLGTYPKLHCNHKSNRDNIYFGPVRLTGHVLRAVDRLRHLRLNRPCEGHDPASPYFWGDLCQKHIKYVRNFVYRDVNLLKINPSMPYHCAHKPYVNYWFSSTDATNVERFCARMSNANLDRLEHAGGVCILYVHFASNFCRHGQLAPAFRERIENLSRRNGWFAPTSVILDHMLAQRTQQGIPPGELSAMERRWVMEKLIHGPS